MRPDFRVQSRAHPRGDAPRRFPFQTLLLCAVAAAAVVSTFSVLRDLASTASRERTLVATSAADYQQADTSISLHAHARGHVDAGGRDLQADAAALHDCRAKAEDLEARLVASLQELKRTTELADRLTKAAALAQEAAAHAPAAGVPPAQQHAGRRVDENEAGWAGDSEGGKAAPEAAAQVERPPPAAAPPAAAARPAVPTLVIGIPSVPRSGNEDYLARTLAYIEQQTVGFLSAGAVEREGVDPGAALGPHGLRLRVLVVNNERGPGAREHAVFNSAVAKYCPAGACKTLTVGEHTVRTAPAWGGVAGGNPTFVFVDNGMAPPDEGADPGSPDVPGSRVRRQTRDVTVMLDLVTALFGAVPYQPASTAQAPVPPAASSPSLLLEDAAPAQYFMFMEDDFRMCPRGIESLAFLLARADALPAAAASYADTAGTSLSLPWNAIRVSLGLNGAILRSGDVPALSAYYKEHLARRPPDHLLVEWFAGERPQSAATKAGRPHLAFRYNLLEHFGYTSSLRGKASPRYALCYDTMSEGVVFEVEAFKTHMCGHDTVWPCLGGGHPAWASLPSSDIDYPALVAAAKQDSVQTWT